MLLIDKILLLLWWIRVSAMRTCTLLWNLCKQPGARRWHLLPCLPYDHYNGDARLSVYLCKFHWLNTAYLLTKVFL